MTWKARLLSSFSPSFSVHSSYFNRPAALVGARQTRGQRDRGDHARMLCSPAARDVESRSVVNRRAYERQAERDVDRLAERETFDGDHRLIMVTRNHRVELAARCAQENRVRGVRPRHLKSFFAASLDRRRDLRRLLDAEQSALRAVRIQSRDGDARTLDAPTLQLAVRQTRDAHDAILL